jgi:hypothetical protein
MCSLTESAVIHIDSRQRPHVVSTLPVAHSPIALSVGVGIVAAAILAAEVPCAGQVVQKELAPGPQEGGHGLVRGRGDGLEGGGHIEGAG